MSACILSTSPRLRRTSRLDGVYPEQAEGLRMSGKSENEWKWVSIRVIKYVLSLLFCVSALSLHATNITIANKSSEPSIAALSGAQPSKQLIKPHQSKKFVAPLTELQPLSVRVESKMMYWPAVFELKLMAPGQLVIKRDSLVVSTKFSKKRALCASPLKIAYYGKPGLHGQEIGFIA